MTTRALAAAFLVALLFSGPVHAQKIVTLPVGSWATDITPDGEVVVGTWAGGNGFIWRWRVDPSPTIVLGGSIEAVSDDGAVVTGNIIDPLVNAQVAAIWTAATGWQGLGWLPNAQSCPSRSTTYDISGDGSTVVGLSWDGCNARGFRWTAATGLQELQKLGLGNNRCSAISGDGSTLGGFAQTAGLIDRSPAYWAPNTSGELINAAAAGEVAGFNEDGSRSVGQFGFPGQTYYRAFVRDQQAGSMTNLGSIHTNWSSDAQDLSEDGRTIVGYDFISLAREAWVWTTIDGLISLNSRLTTLGVTGAPPLQVCRAISDDGNVIVGGGQGAGPFDSIAFIVELSSPQPQWTDLGNGLPGINGIPSLAGTGALTAGSATSVVLTNGKAGSPAAYVIGLSSLNAPFKQGVLVAFPDLLLTIPALAPSGSVSLPFTWPAGLPSGFPVYWQCLVLDPAGPAGFSISNALQSTTP